MPLGNHAIKRQPLVIDTAISAGVRHFYPSEFGTDLTAPGNWEERYYRDKVLTREHLQKRATDTPGLGYTSSMAGLPSGRPFLTLASFRKRILLGLWVSRKWSSRFLLCLSEF